MSDALNDQIPCRRHLLNTGGTRVAFPALRRKKESLGVAIGLNPTLNYHNLHFYFRILIIIDPKISMFRGPRKSRF